MTKTAQRATPSLLERPELRTARVVSVALLRPVDKVYSYYVPESLADRIQPGMRISVPFGRSDTPAPAFCLSISIEPWESTLKPVLKLIDDKPLLNEKQLELGRWIARYYAAHLGRTLDLMVPAAAKGRAGRKRIKYALLNPSVGGLASSSLPKEGPGDVADSAPKLSKKQTAVISVLETAAGPLAVADLCKAAGCTEAVVKTLADMGFVRFDTEYEPVAPEEADVPRHEPDFDLNADQKTAIEHIAAAVAANEFTVQVLHGVTGSGKTEVYIHAIRRALSQGQQAVMLVPEIALTTQTVQRLRARFDRLAVIHSGLTDVQRARMWHAVAAGDFPVVVGTRSAVFAPCPNLGLIIVDEEAEPSFKSQAAPRYHTRDVAIKRAHLEGIPVVLGSATPSLETWHNLQTRKHFQLIRLPHRVRGLPQPTMHLVDMRLEHRERRGVHLLSRAMESHLQRTLDAGEQAVLLLNRRGYASYLHCPRCKTVISCPNCSVHMVFHATTELAHCHYCHARLAVPNRCQLSGCDGNLVRFGMGTQRVEEELRRKFPQARLRRIDADTMTKAADYGDLLTAFERREFDWLVGTQMIAKGLDFPFVSFVGVVSADTALALDDFRSEERTFQLVLQVAGRSGRGDAPGHVVVQMFAEEKTAGREAVKHAINGDFEAFARTELGRRYKTRLPPFTRLVRIVLNDARISKLQAAAKEMADRIRDILSKRGIINSMADPYPSRIPRMHGRYRYDILLVFDTAGALLSALDVLKDEGALRASVKTVTVDVDPVSLQ